MSLHGSIRVDEGGLVSIRRGSIKSRWWREIVNLGAGKSGRWLWENLEKKVGDGEGTNFWNDVWAGESSLRNQFPRLFHLSRSKDKCIKEMGAWVEGVWSWRWEWRKDLFDLDLNVFSQLLSTVNRCKVQEDIMDCWNWRVHPAGVYMTKLDYMEITDRKSIAEVSEDQRQRACGEEFRLVWSKIAPSKVSTMAWRLLWDRIPTKLNLVKRGVQIPMDEMECYSC